MDRHDEIKKLLGASRKLVSSASLNENINEIRKKYNLLTEQSGDGESVFDKVNIAKSVEDEIDNDYETYDDGEKDEPVQKDDKKQAYRISGGLLVIHGDSTKDLELTTEEKQAFQETMDEFINQVSDLVDFNQLNVYTDNVDWSEIGRAHV